MNGTTLEQLLQSGEPMAAAEAVPILRKCAVQLDAFPTRQRLSPAQIMVDGPEVHISECEEKEKLPASDHGLPEPSYASYLSPEEILGTVADQRSTEFSFAVIAYQMLTGRKPFIGGNNLSALIYEICAAAPPRADGQNHQLNAATAEVLNRALAKDPTQRFENCGVFVQALERAVSQPASQKIAEPLSVPERDVAATGAAFAELPPARSVSRSRPEPSRGSGIGPFRMALIGIVAACILVFLLDRHSAPPIPQQTVDPRVGPVAPPPPPEDNGEDENTATSTSTSVTPQPSITRPSQPVQLPQQQSRPVEMPKGKTPAATRRAAETHLAPRPSVPQLGGGDSVDVELLTVPPGGLITVDGHSGKSCTAPCTLLLPAGRHVLSAELPGYSTAQRIFNTPETSSLIIPLGVNQGTLIVSSSPLGVTLYVDGREVGQCPITLHLSAGQHRLEGMYGGQSQQQIVNIQADSIQGATFNLR